ncbi:exonuclease domain-containing protein [Capnocytophaga haemolytica]
MYAILDIETTGGKYDEEGITEIAIYRYDGHALVDQFISFVNPEREILPYVSQLTKITNKMLRNAPKFYEVAKRIVEITEGCILVAHNAEFDYRILQTEFRRLGYDYIRTTLCTVELSQRLLPDCESYSLGKLVRSLGIPISDRHRATGDALATLELFKYLLEKDSKKAIITASVKNDPRLERKARHLRIVEELPSTLGVFYLHNKEGRIIYIGKDKNIKGRVNQLFTSQNKRDAYLQRNTHKVTYQETGNTLIATLNYLEEIELNHPRGNRDHKPAAVNINYVLTSHYNKEGYLCFAISLMEAGTPFITTFESKRSAKSFLGHITKEFELNPHFQGLRRQGIYPETSVEEYNTRAMQVLTKYGFIGATIAIVDKGRTVSEHSAILIVDGQIKGYGFFGLNYQLTQLSFLENLVTPLPDSLRNRHLLQEYIRTTPSLKIINLKEQKPFHND